MSATVVRAAAPTGRIEDLAIFAVPAPPASRVPATSSAFLAKLVASVSSVKQPSVWRGQSCDASHFVVEAKSDVGAMLGSVVVQTSAHVVFTKGQCFGQYVHSREVAQILQKRFQGPAK